jgi:hypothetical protein
MRRRRADAPTQTSVRVSVATRDRLKALLKEQEAEWLRQRGHRYFYGRRYGDPAPVTMDSVISGLLELRAATPATTDTPAAPPAAKKRARGPAPALIPRT